MPHNKSNSACAGCSDLPQIGPTPIAEKYAHPRKGPRGLLKQLLQTVANDPNLRRLAQILAWAESVEQDSQRLARVCGAELGRCVATEQECSASFVLWQETRLTNAHACASLDPDAACRYSSLLHSVRFVCSHKPSAYPCWKRCWLGL
jgi:hypothetical protein